MKFLFFKLKLNLKKSIEIIDDLEGAGVQEGALDILNELYIVHRELFKLLEKVENISSGLRK
jgi:hypothetical protein